MSDSRISVGDLVVVVRDSALTCACPNTATGKIGVALSKHLSIHVCSRCGKGPGDERIVFTVDGVGVMEPHRLKRIDPLSDDEISEAQRELEGV